MVNTFCIFFVSGSKLVKRVVLHPMFVLGNTDALGVKHRSTKVAHSPVTVPSVTRASCCSQQAPPTKRKMEMMEAENHSENNF